MLLEKVEKKIRGVRVSWVKEVLIRLNQNKTGLRVRMVPRGLVLKLLLILRLKNRWLGKYPDVTKCL